MVETKIEEQGVSIQVLNFADSKIPKFKEVRNKDYVLFGEENDYPEYLTYLFNKSAKHNAIVNGKSNYILGGGLDKAVPLPGGFVDIKDAEGKVIYPARKVNREGETMLEIMWKCNLDIEIYGGFYIVVIYNRLGQIAEIYHVDFYKMRRGKVCGYYFKENWHDKSNRQDPDYFDEFDPNAQNKTIQIFDYKEYRPGCGVYPLPGFVGACNYIELDIEISKFHLSSIKNGMVPSKMIQFFNGEPTEEKKKKIERQIEDKWSGSERAGKIMIVYNSKPEQKVEVTDLTATEIDKLWEVLNKTGQQEIFTGHQVTSGMLFGIKTEGQLGGSTELRLAYEIFTNTYAKPKQKKLEVIINYFGGLMGAGTDYCIKKLDPVGIVLDAKDVLDKIPTEFIYDLLNIPKQYRPAAPAPTTIPASQPGAPTDPIQAGKPVNDNIKNLTGRQHQQLLRIIRQYSTGKLNKATAMILLKTGLGLDDDDIKQILGIMDEEDTTAQGFADQQEQSLDSVIEMFDSCGELKDDYHIITNKVLYFETAKQIAEEELTFYKECFAGATVSNTDSAILDLIRKDPKVTPEVIAKTLGSTKSYVASRIAALTKSGMITSATVTVGVDEEIERTVTEPRSKTKGPDGAPETTDIQIRYSYEVKPGIGPAIIDTTRPFCEKLINLNRLYSRFEIERISERLGYSVWDRRGGWWGDSPTCRHRWVSHIVVKKGKK